MKAVRLSRMTDKQVMKHVIGKAAELHMELDEHDFEKDSDGWLTIDGMDPHDWLYAMNLD